MEWTDGSKYHGHWEAGVQHGLGIMYFPDGTKRAGFFDQNVFKLPLKSRDMIRPLEEEMPSKLLNQLLDYLEERVKKIMNMKDEFG